MGTRDGNLWGASVAHKKTAARQDQTRQSSTGDGAGNNRP
jgi:hypothetical protein